MPATTPLSELFLWVVGGVVLSFALAWLFNKLRGL